MRRRSGSGTRWPLLTVALGAVAVAAVLALVVTTVQDPVGGPQPVPAGGTPPGTPGPAGTGPASLDPGGAGPGSVAPDPTGPPEPVSWQQASAAFLADYVDPDGRVVRRDQGGDTVSEGQAYAMLVAVAVQDRESFTRVWSWTRQELLRPDDGLLSWRWADGAVVDAESAADADLDAARALVLAGEVFAEPGWSEAGTELGRAVLEHETVETGDGRILLAGTWATETPWAYNHSYPSPAATRVLDRATPDPRWQQLDEGTRAVLERTLEEVDLPPDWAQVREDGTVEAMPGAAGRGNEGVRYGYDATRMPLRFAESCDEDDVALAARLVEPLARFPGTPAARDLGGRPLTEDASVVAASGQAAALAAAGEDDAAGELLLRVGSLDRAAPSYYGSAWNALSRVMLTTEVLGGCAPLAS